MMEPSVPASHGTIDALILRALVRKLVTKNVLSPSEVRDLLFDAATRLDVVGGEQTPQAAHAMVEGDLAPAFLEESGGGAGE